MQDTEKQEPVLEEGGEETRAMPEDGGQNPAEGAEQSGAAGEAAGGDAGSPEGEASEEGQEEENAPDNILDPAEARHEKEIAAWKDKYTRLYAEFDNFRKRSEKEKSQMFEMGAKDVIEKLLPVVDNFERALGTVGGADREDAFVKGVEGIYKQIQKMFTDLDVQPIPAEGEKFDPNLHNAVMTDTESDVPEDTITQDLQKGYTYRGSVVRHSMVKVRKGE